MLRKFTTARYNPQLLNEQELEDMHVLGQARNGRESETPSSKKNEMHNETISSKIPIVYKAHLKPKETHIVYESFKPNSILQMQNFMRFIVNSRTIVPNMYTK